MKPLTVRVCVTTADRGAADRGIRWLTGVEATENRSGMICCNILHTITDALDLSQGKYTKKYDG